MPFYRVIVDHGVWAWTPREAVQQALRDFQDAPLAGEPLVIVVRDDEQREAVIVADAVEEAPSC